MNTLILLLSIALFIMTATAAFLGSEMLKKFGLMRRFVGASRQLIEYHYDGGRTPGMYNIVLRASRPFSVLVGFELKLFGQAGFDYYGYVEPNAEGVAVISTYLGRGATTFQFFVDCNGETACIVVSCDDEEQKLTPHAVYPPHWWQRFGFFS